LAVSVQAHAALGIIGTAMYNSKEIQKKVQEVVII
jgi:hypothetical protein